MMRPKKVVGILAFVCLIVGLGSFLRRDITPRGELPGDGESTRGHAAATAPQSLASATNPPAPVLASKDPFVGFRGWVHEYESAPDAAGRAALLSRGIELAQARREALEGMIRLNPKLALEQTVPLADRSKLPPEVASLLEERVNGRGNFSVLGSVPAPGDTTSRPAITREVTMGARHYNAFVYGARAKETTKVNIPLHGIAVGKSLAVNENPARALEPQEVQAAISAGQVQPDALCGVSGEVSTSRGTQVFADYGGQIYPLCCSGHLAALNKRLLELDSNGDSGNLAGDGGIVGTNGVVSSSHTKGVKTLLFMRVAFPDDLREPITAPAAATLMEQVNQYFVSASFNNTAIISTISPLLVLPQSKIWYGTNGVGVLQSDARQAAKVAGLDYLNYDLDIVELNSVPGFNWGGLASVGGRGVWLQDSGLATVCHELGHNYGLLHANYWNTDRPPLTGASPLNPGNYPIDPESVIGHSSVIGPGTDSEYGDPFDIMGGGSGDYNVVAKYSLLWLPDTFIAEAPVNATNRIYAMDGGTLVPGRLYGSKIKKDSTRNYWVSHRSKLTTSAPEVGGVELHWDSWYGTDGTAEILDTTPGSGPGIADAPLPLGRTFDDPESDLHITLFAKGGSGADTWADVVVNRGPFPLNQPPTLALQVSSLFLADTSGSVTLTATASDANGDVLSYFWDFGDGTFGTNSSTVTKQWTAIGDYVVRCEVSDMKGGVTRSHTTVQVGQPGTVRINGKVLDTSGNPVAGVRVDNGAVTNNAVATNYVWTYTDSDGTFTLSGLQSTNSYICEAYLHGYRTIPLDFVNPVAMAGNSSDNIDFLASPLTRVGVVTNTSAMIGIANSGIFTINRSGSGSTNQDEAVVFGTGGTAAYGTDYQLLAPLYSPTSPPPWQVGPVATLYLTNVGLNSGFGTFVTNVVGFGAVVIPAGSTSVQVVVNPLSSAGSSASTIDPLTASIFVAYPMQELAFVTNTNMTNNPSPYVPGWEVLDDSLLHPTFYQTYPDYNLAYGREEATMILQPSQGPGLPLVSVVAVDGLAYEGSAGGGVVAVMRYGDPTQPLTVQYTTSGTAVAGVDFAPLSGTLVIPAGQNTALIAVRPLQNLFVHTNVSVVVNLTAQAGYKLGTASATVVIEQNNPEIVTLDVPSPVAVPGGANGVITVTRSGDTTNDLTVKYLVSGAARSGVDYQPLTGSVLIPSGSLSASIQIAALKNLASTGDVAVVVTLSPSTTYQVLVPDQASILIQDPLLPVVTITASTNAVSQPSTSGTLTFTRTGGVALPLVVNFQTSGSALAGYDYTPIGNSVVIPAGSATATVTVNPEGNSFQEDPHVLYVQLLAQPGYNLGNPSLAELDFSAANSSALPAVGFVLQSGANPAAVTSPAIAVQVSSVVPKDSPITVSFEVIGGSAQPGVDFTLKTNSLMFTNGESTIKDLPITIIPQTNEIGDRTLVLQLVNPLPYGTNDIITNMVMVTNNMVVTTNTVVITNVVLVYPPTNAIIINPTFFYTIQNDYAGKINVAATGPTASFSQGLNGAFTITRTGLSDATVTVNYQLAGNAVSGIDYAPVAGSVVMPAGTNSVTIPVIPLNNPTLGPSHTLVLDIVSAQGGLIGSSSSAAVQILNANGTIQFASTSYFAQKTDSQALIPVQRTGDTNSTVSVDYFISNGTAQTGLEYSATNGTLVFAPGQTVQYVTIYPLQDNRVTGTLTVNILLANPTGGAPLAGQSSAVLYIQDVNSAFNFLQAGYLVAENATNAVITVVRSGTGTNKATVDYATSDGTATAGVGYSNVTGTLYFDSGVFTQTFLVPIIDQTNTPSDLSLNLALLNETGNAVPGTLTNAVLTILSDNSALQFDSPTYSVNEWATNAFINVRRTGGTVNPVKVDYATLNGTAVAGLKYVATNGTLSFQGDSYIAITNGSGGVQRVQGDTIKTIVIPVIEDNTGDGNQTFSVVLTNARGPAGSLAGTTVLGNPAQTVVTILDDKSPGSPVIGFQPGAGPNGNVNTVAPQPDGRVVIGGDFTMVDGTLFGHVARLNGDGTMDSSFNPGLGADRPVHAVRLQPDGKILVGGAFASFNSNSIARLARLNVDGSIDTNFITGFTSGTVRAITLQTNGQILVGGDFGLTRLNADGSPDGAFRTGAAPDGAVLALAVQSDGHILAGGSFNSFGGSSSPHLIRLNPDGTVDSSFSVGYGSDQQINAIAIQSSGRIVIGGVFSEWNAQPSPALARLNPNGSLDQTFGDGAGPSDVVNALDVYQDQILVAGQFSQFAGNPAGYFLRLNSDGSPDLVVQTEKGANAPVLAAVFAPSGQMVIGGAFTLVNNLVRNHVALLHGNEFYNGGVVEFAVLQTTVSAGSGSVTLTVVRQGSTNSACSVQFAAQNGTAVALSDYVPTNGVLNFAPGQTAQTLTVGILDDVAATNTLSFQVALSSPSGVGLGFISTANISVVDDKPAFLFAQASYQTVEDAGTVTLTVLRQGTVTNAATVGFATADGTAIAGVNYTAQQGTLSFAPGQTNAAITIGLINQNLVRSTNTFTVSLNNPGVGNLIAAPSVATVRETGAGGAVRFSLNVNQSFGGTVSPQGGVYLSNAVVSLQATANPGFVFVGWQGTVNSTNNSLILTMNRNYTEAPEFRVTQYTDNFGTGNFSAIPWRTNSPGGAPWFIETNIVSGGRYAAQSGAITNSQSSTLSLEIFTQAGTAAFDYKVSSEANWDWLEFSLNGQLISRWSGEAGWSTYYFQVPAGTNLYQWTYGKDPTLSAGLDAAFISNLLLPPATFPVTNAPPTLAISGAGTGVYQISINGVFSLPYTLQASTDLTHWLTLSNALLTTNGGLYNDPATTNTPFRFYRAVSTSNP